MGCKCCRWPVNACRMAMLARLVPLAFTALVLFLAVHSFWNDAAVLGTLLLALCFPGFGFSPARKLPPGPAGVPVLGYLPFLGAKPHQKMAALAKKYGPLVHIQLGSFPGFVVANARLAKEVLATHDQVFASRPDSFVTWAKYFAYYDLRAPEARRSMGTANPGPFLRSMRRLVAAELMAPKRLELTQAIRAEEMDAMVQGVLAEAKEGDGVVDLNRAVGAMAMNIMARMVIRKRYYAKDVAPEVRKEASEFQKLLVSVMNWAGHPFLQDFVPALRPLMSLLSGNEREMARIAKRTDAFLESILQEHRQRSVNSLESSQDFVDVLVQCIGDDGKRLDDKTVKAITMEMFMAGVETTSTSTEWTLAELVHHPGVQSKLQAELDAVVGLAREVRESDLARLPYLRAVVLESFRLHPASPLMLPHSNTRPVELQGYHIPADSHVFVNVWAIGRDSAVWTRPEVFDPERFMKSTKQKESTTQVDGQTGVERLNSVAWMEEHPLEMGGEKSKPSTTLEGRSMDEIDFKGGHFELLPFGSGRRMCPGMASGATVVRLAVARLVHGFRWSLADDCAAADMDMEEQYGMNLQMRSPLYRVCCEARLPMEVYKPSL